MNHETESFLIFHFWFLLASRSKEINIDELDEAEEQRDGDDDDNTVNTESVEGTITTTTTNTVDELSGTTSFIVEGQTQARTPTPSSSSSKQFFPSASQQQQTKKKKADHQLTGGNITAENLREKLVQNEIDCKRRESDAKLRHGDVEHVARLKLLQQQTAAAEAQTNFWFKVTATACSAAMHSNLPSFAAVVNTVDQTQQASHLAADSDVAMDDDNNDNE